MNDKGRIDRDVLHVAAENSEKMADVTPKPGEVRFWLAKLPAEEKDGILASLITDEDRTLATGLLRRFLEERDAGGDKKAGQAKRRTVGELLEAAEEYAEERQRIEEEKRAEEKRRRDYEAAAARARYLDGLAGKEEKLWTNINSLIATKLPKSYDQAITLLRDLRDLAGRNKNAPAFNTRFEALRAAHVRKPSLIERLDKASL